MRVKHACLAVIIALAVASAADAQTPKTAELAEQLSKRVRGLNAELTAKNFPAVWEYLGPGLKQDNPRDRYIANLKAKIDRWDVQAAPDVWLGERTKKTNRPVGEAVSRVQVRTPDGAVVPIEHRTVWIWIDGPRAAGSWYLARETITEGSPGAKESSPAASVPTNPRSKQ